MLNNSQIIELVRDITVAALESKAITASDRGNDVAAFMQSVFDKLTELNNR
jgi:hypothetical protein